jgi:PadR family transcriptional regulator, regulatory protein PadR
MAKAKSKPARSREAARQAVQHAGVVPAGRDPFTGELRRREVLPLLVLHYISEGPSYGNRLIEKIGEVTSGVMSVNPNTMYPLLRQLEERGLIQGKWEHPERRTRRNYEITAKGRKEYERLNAEVRPFLDAARSSIDEIVREVYGA